MAKMQELRNMSEIDLKKQYTELSKEIFELVNELRVTRKLEKPHLLSAAKKQRARVLTALNEKRGNNG